MLVISILGNEGANEVVDKHLVSTDLGFTDRQVINWKMTIILYRYLACTYCSNQTLMYQSKENVNASHSIRVRCWDSALQDMACFERYRNFSHRLH